LGKHTRTGEVVEVKLEPAQEPSALLDEARVHNDVVGIIGIPSIHWCGSDGVYNAMVTDLLGPTVEDLFQYCHNKFSLKTVLLFAVQALTRLEGLHKASYIHGRITPSSFLIGLGKWGNQVSIADLSHAKKYAVQGSHTPNSQGKFVDATNPYASLNTHCGMEPAPRDDLESLAYVMYYFCCGRLPSRNKTPEELFHEFPVEFCNYLEYVRSLDIDEMPDHDFLRSQFWSLFAQQSFQNDYKFDWTIFKYSKGDISYAMYGESQLLAQPMGTLSSPEQLVDTVKGL
jgi:casein kinase I family protein HRR25